MRVVRISSRGRFVGSTNRVLSFNYNVSQPFSSLISSEFDSKFHNLLKQKLFHEAEVQFKELLLSSSSKSTTRKIILEMKNSHRKYFGMLLASLARAAKFETCDRVRLEMISGEHRLIPNIICYNIIINSMSKAMECERSLDILQEMRSHGLTPDLYSFSPIIHSYLLQSKPDQAFDVINQMKQSNISPSVGVYNSIIRSFIREQKPEKVIPLVMEMIHQQIVPEKPIILAVLNSLYDLKRPKAAENLLKLLLTHQPTAETTSPSSLHELLTDIRTYHMLMKSYIESSLLTEAERVLLALLTPDSEYSRLGILPIPQTFSLLMNGYTSGGQYDHTDRIFQLLLSQDPKVKPDLICYTDIMNSFNKAGRYADTIRIFRQMQMTPDLTCINVYLQAKKGSESTGGPTLSQVLSNFSFPPKLTTDTYNMLIYNAVEMSHPEQGEILLRSMTATNLKPDVITYSTLIHGYIKCELYQDAERMYIEMLSNAITPNEITFHSLIMMSCRSGNVSQALKYLHEMEHDHQLTPLLRSYHELLRYYSSRSDLTNTEKLFFYLKSHPSLGPLDLRSYKYLLKLYEKKNLFPRRNLLRRELEKGLKSGSVVVGRWE
jgi:pentatricopeptide repeat protein